MGVANDELLAELYPQLRELPAPMCNGAVNMEELSLILAGQVACGRNAAAHAGCLGQLPEHLAAIAALQVPLLPVGERT